MATETCACGQPLHYTNPRVEAMIRELIALVGDEMIEVSVRGRRFKVQRHYIALHGLNAQDLLRGFLPFEELK